MHSKHLPLRLVFLCALAATMVLIAAGPSLATNGMNMISFGGQEAGMGGASLAVSDNAFATNNNPAGLTQIKNGSLDFGFSLLMPHLEHKDAFAGNVDGESNMFPLPMFAIAKRIGETPFVFGFGLFGQGGMGAEFENFTTMFGNKDQTYTNVGYLKATPTLAYQINDQLSVGVAFNVGYATMEMKMFPSTVVPPMPPMLPMGFAGFELQDIYSLGYGAKFGLQYKPNEQWTLALVYTTRSQLDFDHGKIKFAAGSGLGTYDASVSGFSWPQSVGVGVSVRPTEKLLLALDVTWYNWANAIDVVTINYKTPAGEQELPFQMHWKDQIAIAVGAAYDVNERLTLRAGYNYGQNPVPDANLSPLFPAITEHHVTAGLGYKFTENWQVNAAWEHAFENSVTYTNNGSFFGANAVERHSQDTVHLFFAYRF